MNSVQAYGPHFHPLSGVNLKGLKATSAGMRGFVSGTASSQALHMLSASKEPVGSQPAQQANQVASSLSLSLPGLSALLAGKHLLLYTILFTIRTLFYYSPLPI